MTRTQRFFCSIWEGMGSCALVLLMLAAAIGWAMNLYKLFSATAGGEIAVRVIGIFMAPIGAIAGWF